MLETLLFDLDGVLVDSVPPIGASLNRALVVMGRDPLPPEQIRPLIGPPLEQIAAIALGIADEAEIRAFVAHFRAAYTACFLDETRPAEGLHDVLSDLAEDHVLLVATSKPEAFARPLLEHIGVANRFAAIVGRSLELDHDSKAQVIGRALALLDDPAPERILMIGDREHDVIGARAHGIDTVGVLSGAGDAAELREAGALHLVDDLPHLRRWLRGGRTGR